MSDNQELKDILDAEYKKIYQERMAIEMADFAKMEEHWSEIAPPMESSAQLWYLSLNGTPDETVPTINEDYEEGVELSVKFKGSYPDVFDALNDSVAIEEIKRDACVGVITRSDQLITESQRVCHLSTLTTPSGVHIIARSGDELYSSSTPKYQIVRGESSLVDSLIEACFTW
jgi:hypothetical protein